MHVIPSSAELPPHSEGGAVRVPCGDSRERYVKILAESNISIPLENLETVLRLQRGQNGLDPLGAPPRQENRNDFLPPCRAFARQPFPFLSRRTRSYLRVFRGFLFRVCVSVASCPPLTLCPSRIRRHDVEPAASATRRQAPGSGRRDKCIYPEPSHHPVTIPNARGKIPDRSAHFSNTANFFGSRREGGRGHVKVRTRSTGRTAGSCTFTVYYCLRDKL